jgi:hypothetical protein
MGALLVRVSNAHRQPLDDSIDVFVASSRTDSTVAEARGVSGTAAVRFEGLTQGQPYVVKVFPKRHRPVAQFAFPGPDDNPTLVHLFSPLDPEKVRSVTFPPFAGLDPELTRVLGSSRLAGLEGEGEGLYGKLSDLQRAGLFNLFSKMHSFAFDDHRTVWSFVDTLFEVRADRVFGNVQVALHDLVRGAADAGRFHPVSSSLHEPPPGYLHAGSFKTDEPYGNLQLTFFGSLASPRTFQVDADIDDAAGLGHAFQVMRNWITKGTTHPYDIHEILAFRQDVTLPYDLV